MSERAVSIPVSIVYSAITLVIGAFAWLVITVIFDLNGEIKRVDGDSAEIRKSILVQAERINGLEQRLNILTDIVRSHHSPSKVAE